MSSSQGSSVGWKDNIDGIDITNSYLNYRDLQSAKTTLFPPETSKEPASPDTRPTPNSLGWTPSGDFLNLYNFVVAKSKDPYFELQDIDEISPQTPARVYLDYPSYELLLKVTNNAN